MWCVSGVMYGVLCVDVAVCGVCMEWCVVCGCSGVWCVDVAVCGVCME